MKKSNLLILLVLTATACSRKSPETLINKWSSFTTSHDVVERKLASAPQGQCLKDVFSVETMKAEIKEIEKNFAGAQKVTGNWKHIDLSRLPVPQANFLKSYGDMIGDLRNPGSIDYSGCYDVPCIFNKVYGKEGHFAGYVHYLWYLRFGNLLSADNKSPSQASKNAGEYNGKIHPLSSYLYNDNELYAFWRLSHMLKTPHTTLSYLKEIQRVPRGEKFEGKFERACGLAYSSGFILLNDGCLTLRQNTDEGYFYHAVTHELTHHVDFQEGRGTRLFYRSHKQDYLDLAGMFLKEFVNEQGENVRQWEHKPGIKLVTSYAGGNPQENFAESVAVFRVEGDKTKSNITPDHYSFVSRDYYQNRAFHREAISNLWLNSYTQETGKEVFKAVVDCSKEGSSVKSGYFRPGDFSSPVMPSLLSCIGVKAAEIQNSLQAKVSLKEPEGCVSMKDRNFSQVWNEEVRKHLTLMFDKYLQELHKDKDYLARIQEFYNQVTDKTLATEAYVACFAEPNEKSCYDSQLRIKATDKALSLNLPEDQTKEMADMYVSYHSFDQTKEETLTSYRNFVAAHLEDIRTEAASTWDSCHSVQHSDDESPTGSLFQVADGYMISSLYNCLNAQIPDSVKEIIRNFTVDGFKIQHAKEEVILHQEVLPQLVNILKEKYKAERQKEVLESRKVIDQDNGDIRKQLLQNFDWVKNIVDTNQIISDCKREGYKLINFMPLYHVKSSLFGKYLEENSCYNISSSLEFNNWLNSAKGDFSEKVTTGLEDKVTEMGKLRAEECIKQYPMDTVINKLRYRKQREACLVDEWPKIESKVIADAQKDPVVIKFQIKPEVMKVQLEGKRRRLQLRVIKEYFN